jgi:hypothetical protein
MRAFILPFAAALFLVGCIPMVPAPRVITTSNEIEMPAINSWDASFEAESPDRWYLVAKTRFADPVIFMVHGGYDENNVWTAYPAEPRKPLPVQQIAENKEHTRERIKKAQNQNDKLFYCPNSPTRSFKTQALFVQHMLNKHKDYSYGLNKPRTKRASKHDSDHTSSQHASKPENQETSKHDSSQTLIKTDPNIPYTKLDLSLPNIAKLKLL